MEAREVQAKYVCLDIVGYSTRPVESQIKILRALNDIVKKCVDDTRVPQDEEHRMFIPTGDGMCIAFFDIAERDIHLKVARGILNAIKERAVGPANADSAFEVRVGIHAQTDHVIKDINQDDNLAGAGINFAFRVMDLSDGGEIFASQEVYRGLKDYLAYKDAFRPESATVKHNIVEDIYRFTGDDAVPRRALPKVIRKQQRAKQLSASILDKTKVLGLKSVYRCRDQHVVEEIIGKIQSAKERIYLSGVGLPDLLTDSRLLRALNTKARELNDADTDKQNVRLLLLDGFRSPAIFRALMESDCSEAEKIVRPQGGRRVRKYADPYFNHKVYMNFEMAHKNLSKLPNLASAVRFYGHAPSCWLAIIDHEAYFQPYTFGDGSDAPGGHAIGWQMPVFRFEGRRRTPYRILEDHFNKLWLTSDIDLFHTGARIMARDRVLWETFERRREAGSHPDNESKWLEHIYNVLCNPKNPLHDRRTYLRRPCISALVAHVKWSDDYARFRETETKIVDFSLRGALLRLDADTQSELFLSLPKDRDSQTREIMVELRVEPEGGWPKSGKRRSRGIPDVAAARRLVDDFTKPTNNRFVYVRKTFMDGKPCAAFQAWTLEGSKNA